MPSIDFSKIKDLLASSTTFSLTEKQYEELTGRKLPKDTSYLIKGSALARFAAKNGLRIAVQEKTISFVDIENNSSKK